ncbi:MAG: hypothetical protein ABL974_10945 [Prosthecobacter sp.]
MSEAMMTHSLLRDKNLIRFGATRAQADMEGILEAIRSQTGPVQVMLDYNGIEAVNGSYVRASVAWLTRCGIATRAGEPQPKTPPLDPWEIRALPLRAVFVANLSGEVREEIDLYFKKERLPCLEAISWNGDQVDRVRQLGHLDQQLIRALDCLVSLKNDVVAEDLWKAFPDDRIGLTAWNNRLSELYQRHMVSRAKDGKFWRYSLAFKEVEYGI